MNPRSVAVDPASGEVYVVDGTSTRVWKFSSAGEFELLFGKNVNATPGTPTPNLCTAADLQASGAKCGPGGNGSGPGEFFNTPETVVVDAESNVWVGEVGRLLQFDTSGHYVSEAALPGGAEGRSFARDSAGDFYAIKGGQNEQQGITFPGFADGDTFRLGNLPPGCSLPSADPIEYRAGSALEANVDAALASKCGTGNLFPLAHLNIYARGKFTDTDIGELTCEAVTGGGGCLVSTLLTGKPSEVIKLEASGSPVDVLTSLGSVYSGAPRALTVDGADNLYIGEEAGPYRFKLFNPTGELVSQFGAGQVIGTPGGNSDSGNGANVIAVGQSAASLYSVSGDADVGQIFDLPEPGPLPGNERAEDVLPSTATLAATLNPEGDASTYFFEYGTDQSYGSTTPVQALAGSGFEEEEVEAAIDHLLPETTYHFRLVATNHCNNAEPAEECTVEGEDTTFTTPPAVEIEAQWATDLAARTVTLHGQLDPLGVPASWWVEYGTDTSYGASTPERNLGSGFGAVSVSEEIAGLKPGTTYHYRFAARDERDGTIYTVHGADRTITTQVGGLGFELADARAWEMVSPPEKHGGLHPIAVQRSGRPPAGRRRRRRPPLQQRRLDRSRPGRQSRARGLLGAGAPRSRGARGAPRT